MEEEVTRERLAAIAARASCDPRTVLTYLHGLAVRPLVRERIEKALADLNLGHLVRKAS